MKNESGGMKELRAITTTIQAHQDALSELNSDITRAHAAISEAQAFQAELDAISDKRARVRAEAFVRRTAPDTGALDAEEQGLEKAARRAIEDATAAELALGMLNEKSATLRAEVATLAAKRCTATIDQLVKRREGKIDGCVALYENLRALVADARACDRAILKLDPTYYHTNGVWLYEAMKKEGALPVPVDRCTVRHFERPPRPGGLGGSEASVTSPVKWVGNDPTFGDEEFAALVKELADVGVVIAPPHANSTTPKEVVHDKATDKDEESAT